MGVRRIGAAALLVVAVGAAGCGPTDDDGGAGAGTAGGSCGGSGDQVELTLRFFGGVDVEGFEGLIRQFDGADADVRVRTEVLEVPPLQSAVDLVDHDGTGAVLAQVPGEALQALVATEAIAPLGECLTGEGGPVPVMFEEALRSSRVDGRLWSLPLNVNATLMLYDRGALAEAGLDPQRPPRTLDELHDMAVRLRDRAGLVRPVAWNDLGSLLPGAGAPFVTGDASGVDSPAARAAVSAMAGLVADGLLADPRGPDQALPPIGTGESAFQVGELSSVWAIGAALADGQAPGVDIGVAPVPGLHGPVAPIGGWLAALGAGASRDERAAAWRLMGWLQEPAQQAQLHLFTDNLPTRVDAADDPALREYWDEIPLFAEAWTAMRSAPMGFDGDAVIPGVGCPVGAALDDVVRRGAPLGRLTRAAEEITTANAAFRHDPARFLRASAARQAAASHDHGAC